MRERMRAEVEAGAGLTPEEGPVAWTMRRRQVDEIRRRYVDDAAIVVALTRRLAAPSTN